MRAQLASALLVLGGGCSTSATPLVYNGADDLGAVNPIDLGYSCSTPVHDGGDLPCAVAAVLAAKCQPCHQTPPRNHAPWPLERYEHVAQPWGTFSVTGLFKWQRMAQVTEQDLPHMPPRDHPQLTDGERAVLRGWFTTCAPPTPEGAGCDLEDGGFRGFDLGGPSDGGVDGEAARDLTATVD